MNDQESSTGMRLDQWLKTQGWVDTGGQAKLLIQDGQIMVNGTVELRRRHRVVPGDVIRWEDLEAVVAKP